MIALVSLAPFHALSPRLSLYDKMTWSKIETETALPPIVSVFKAHYGEKSKN